MRRPKDWQIAFLLFSVALALRLFRLDALSFWTDEGITWRFLKQDVVTILGQYFQQNEANPPVYFVILHYWMKIFGDSEFSLRFPSALFGAALVPMVYFTGRLFASRRVGLLAGIFTIFAPFQLLYSQEARGYTLFAFLALASICLTPIGLRWRSSSQKWLYLITTGALLWTHNYGIFVVFAQVIYAWIQWSLSQKNAEEKKTLVAFFKLCALAVISSLPLFGALIIHYKERRALFTWLEAMPSIDLLSLLETYVWVGDPAAKANPSPLVGDLVVFATAAGFLYRLKHTTNWKPLFRSPLFLIFTWVFASFALPLTFSSLFHPVFTARYGFPTSLGLFILIFSSMDPLMQRSRMLFLATAVLIGATGIYSSSYYFTRFQKDPWREVLQEIREQASDKDLVAVLPSWMQGGVADYYNRPGNGKPPLHIEYFDELSDVQKRIIPGVRIWSVQVSPENFHNFRRLMNQPHHTRHEVRWSLSVDLYEVSHKD